MNLTIVLLVLSRGLEPVLLPSLFDTHPHASQLLADITKIFACALIHGDGERVSLQPSKLLSRVRVPVVVLFNFLFSFLKPPKKSG
jgi:hypothetical protein